MNNFFLKLDALYTKWNDDAYKYLLFLYYLNFFTKPLYAFFLGSLAGLSLPPTSFFFLLPFAIPSIIRMTDFCENSRQAFMTGFWFCLGFFMVGFYWVSFAVLHDKDFVWIFPFAFIGIPIILSIYTAILFPIYLQITQFSSAIRKVVFFAVIWVVFEFGRLFIFQFPWNFIGYSMTLSLNMLQITSIIGILGLSFIIMLWACSFHLLLLTGDKGDFIKYFKFFLFNNILLLLLFIFGFTKLSSFKTEFQDIKMRIVQGNTPPSQKATNNVDKGLENYIRLTTSRSLDDVLYILWPEGAIDTPLFNNEEVRNRISNLLTGEQILASGSIRIERSGYSYNIFNSIAFINSVDGITGYDKNHLVPFGEFVPFKSLIPIKAVATKIQDFSRGSGLKSVSLSASVPAFSPLICYEVAFTGNVVKKSDIISKWILNLTNDAWYLKSSGPFQHLEIARVRAIEEGLPLVRVANSGISAVFDEVGNTIAKTRLFKEEILDFYLPKTKSERTLFSLWGNAPLMIGLIIFIIFSIGDYIYIMNDKKINEMGYKIKTRKMDKKNS
jgi:apolipoprotein N-acyltransferase